MAQYTRGKLQFEHREVGTVDGSEDTVESFSCHPPPAGRRTGGNPQLTYDPHQPGSFVQPGERTRIETFAANAGETLSLDTVVGELKTEFDIKKMTIDLANVPQAWRRPVPCFDTVIVVKVKSVLLRIDAVATEALTQGNVNWPQGDTVAQFRIVVPDQYLFTRYFTFNADCCPLPAGVQPPRHQPEEDPSGWSAHNFEPFSFVPSIGVEWELDLNWGVHAEFEMFVPWTDEEMGGEVLPGQPWILPLPKKKK